MEFPSLNQITNVTLSAEPTDDDNVLGNRSHGNVTSNPVAVWTSNKGPEMNKKKIGLKIKLQKQENKWQFPILMSKYPFPFFQWFILLRIL